jgi:hypothetical protein
MTLDRRVIVVVTEAAADEDVVEDEEDIWDKNIGRDLVETLMVISNIITARAKMDLNFFPL